mgnify:CR=1 FL=1
MDNQKRGTYREQFESALKCESLEEAELWMEKEVQYYVEHYEKQPIEAINIIKVNLGYMAGYYDDATAKKIHRLFNAVHPIFGTSTYHRDTSAEEAFKIGKELGTRIKG